MLAMPFSRDKSDEVLNVKRNYLVSLIIGMLLFSACAQFPAQPPQGETQPPPIAGEIERMVEVEAEGVLLHYQAKSFWSADEFSTILRDKDQFSSKLMAKFSDDLSGHGEGNEHATNAKVNFNENEKSTILSCDIHDAVWKSDDSYHATFFWLLGPLGLDFINDNFQESEEGLFWEGVVEDVATTVAVKLPAIDGFAYEAWNHPIGHCHAHVWWEMEEK